MQTPKRLGLFLTFGMSLKKWQALGILERELAPYRLLQAAGIPVTIISYGDSTGDSNDAELASDFDVVTVGVPPLFGFLLPFKLHGIVKRLAWLKTNQMYGAWIPLLCSYLYQKPLIVRCGYEYYRTSVLEKNRPWKLALIYLLSFLSYQRAKKIFLTAPSIATYVAHKFKINSDKITILPNGINTQTFKPPKSPHGAPAYVLYVGRLSAEKNLPLLLKACAQVGVPLVLAGDGPERARLEELALSLDAKTDAKARFLGRVPNEDLPQLYSGALCTALVSIYEGHPKALLEAMATGCAVIGSNVIGIRDVIINNETGILVEPDVTQIAQAIKRLQSEAGLRERLGQAARQFVESEFSLPKVAQLEIAQYNCL